MSVVPQGAVCVLHPLEPATTTCVRCGNFACSQCTNGGTTDLCPSCVARGGGPAFEFNRFHDQGLWNFVWNLFGKHWVMLSAVVLIELMVGFTVAMPGVIVSMATMGIQPKANPTDLSSFFSRGMVAGFAIRFAFTILQQIAVLVLGLGVTQIASDVLHGKPVKLEVLFSQLRKIPQVIFAQLIYLAVFVLPFGGMGLGIFLLIKGSLVGLGATIVLLTFVVMMGLAIWFGIPWAFAFVELALFGGTAVECMQKTLVVAKDKRMEMFICLLACIPMILLGELACCIGIIPAMGLMELWRTSTYLALRKGSELDPLPSAP